MCERALEVKEALTALTVEEKELKTEFLTITDWEHLANLARFLRPFRSLTKANEGLRDAIDRMLPSLEYLLGHLERWRRGYERNDWFGLRIDAAWEKLQKYYAKSDDTVAYIAATVLNPLLKWQWFEEHWTGEELEQWLHLGKQKLQSY